MNQFKKFWSIFNKGTQGIDFGVFWDSVKQVWYATQIGTGNRMYESKDRNDVINWGNKNIKQGVYKP